MSLTGESPLLWDPGVCSPVTPAMPALAPVTFWAGSIWVGGVVLCPVGCAAAVLPFMHERPVADSPLSPSVTKMSPDTARWPLVNPWVTIPEVDHQPLTNTDFSSPSNTYTPVPFSCLIMLARIPLARGQMRNPQAVGPSLLNPQETYSPAMAGLLVRLGRLRCIRS